MAQQIIDLLNEGTEANCTDSFRDGNVILLPADSRMIVTGDIHGHRRNFERIITFADLPANPKTHIIFQEIIHGGLEDDQGDCLSYQVLFDAVRYKLKFPDRVHIIMSNHDTAFISDSEVIKDGREMNRSMRQAIKRQFEQESEKVESAIEKFLFSEPLAVRTANRIWLSHSLPSNRLVNKFDIDVLNKKLEMEDIIRPGSAYLMAWGRDQTQKTLDKMASLLDVDIFILGHQPQSEGFCKAGKNLIIIASDHNHGCLLPVDCDKPYTIQELIHSIVPLASIT